MNIMFYTLYHPSTMIGGIERITCRLVALFSQKGYNVYCMYCAQHERKANKIDTILKDEIFISNIKEEFDKARDFIKDNKINVIINQSFFVGNISNSILQSGIFSNMVFDCGYLRKVIDSLPRKCFLLSCHHLSPRSEYGSVPKNVHRIITNARSISSFIWGCKNIGRYIRIIYNYKNIIDQYYKELYSCSDRLILLSSNYRKEWSAVLGREEMFKTLAIPNMVSYKDYLSLKDIQSKENVALVVARLDEHQKKISRIMRIWKNIESIEAFNSWKLLVVGTGEDEDRYKEYSKEHLGRVTFEGFKNPESFYRKSSVFLMTSAYEGLPIVLVETQQFGCVPIAMNTFDSLSDIISDGESGFIANDEKEFMEKLKKLLSDTALRKRMSMAAIESSKSFSEAQVLNRWVSLFNELS